MENAFIKYIANTQHYDDVLSRISFVSLSMPQQINLMMYGEGLSVKNAAEKVIAVNKYVKNQY